MRYTTRVDERYLELRGATWQPPLDPTAINTLIIDDHRGHPLITTGISMGPVEIEVETSTSPPKHATDPLMWEEVVEFGIEAGDAHVLVVGGQDTTDLSARINPAGPGWYRVRVHASGRDNSPDLVVTSPVEQYLVQAWPQAHAAPTVIALSQASAPPSVTTTARQGIEILDVEVAPEIEADPERAARVNARLEKARETLQRLAERN
ncbi:hypothetical protein [Promicromonospora sp. MEB111]|uniref:hypothetical protein n=1 Tax=Promicromonospora sp. MEB111 TaxID=3040301 RepID=UPI00254A2379|nr:hypothetical protein [Promicromonospora sp. MEB111]